jgi:hypothetical protein
MATVALGTAMTILEIGISFPTAQGKHITEEIFKGARPTDQYSQLKWSQQLVTTTKQRNL